MLKSFSGSSYKILNLMKKFLLYLKKLGFIEGILLFIRLRLIPQRGLMPVSLPGLSHPVMVRGKTTDVYIFEKIFILEEYNNPYFAKLNPKFIIDGGAYVGYSSIFFANKFPESTVVAVEPEKLNFSILEKNTFHYNNIKNINAGIWCKKIFLRIIDLNVGQYGFMVEEVNNQDDDTIEAITISDILRKYDYSELDILKLDTEGAEREIFSSNFDDWLSRTKMIIIELHDFNKEGCTETVYSAINKFNFTEVMRDEENIFFLRSDS